MPQGIFKSRPKKLRLLCALPTALLLAGPQLSHLQNEMVSSCDSWGLILPKCSLTPSSSSCSDHPSPRV